MSVKDWENAENRLCTCFKDPLLLGRKLQFSFWWNRGELLRPGWIWGFCCCWGWCSAPREAHPEHVQVHFALPRPYWVWIPADVVKLTCSSQWHNQQLPVNLIFIPGYPLHVCLTLRCLWFGREKRKRRLVLVSRYFPFPLLSLWLPLPCAYSLYQRFSKPKMKQRHAEVKVMPRSGMR